MHGTLKLDSRQLLVLRKKTTLHDGIFTTGDEVYFTLESIAKSLGMKPSDCKRVKIVEDVG